MNTVFFGINLQKKFLQVSEQLKIFRVGKISKPFLSQQMVWMKRKN